MRSRLVSYSGSLPNFLAFIDFFLPYLASCKNGPLARRDFEVFVEENFREKLVEQVDEIL